VKTNEGSDLIEDAVGSDASEEDEDKAKGAEDAGDEGESNKRAKKKKKKSRVKETKGKTGKTPTSSKTAFVMPQEPDYIDYAGFCEAMVMLQISETDEKVLMEAFTSSVNSKGSEPLESIKAPYAAFRKAWCKLCDAASELRKRKLKPDKGLLGDGRNRERLNKWLTKYEEVYFKRLSELNTTIEDLRRTRREHADERRQKIKDKRLALKRAAERFAAIRNQEKRLEIKRDQEDRAKKRMEEKVLRNKLMQRQAENKLQRESQIREANQAAENLRADEVRRRGWDKIDLSISKLRAIPEEISSTKSATNKLSYVVFMDVSHNMIDKLPESNFFFWLTSMRHFKASKNRLETIPAAEFHLAVSLEIVELDNNRLTHVPETLGLMQKLQRLDLSSNSLTSLPSELGDCLSLKYLNLHSNKIKYLPNRIGNLINLEHFNISRNMLIELPEETQFMACLLFLDVAGNYLSTLPTNIGNCERLKYIDASVNRITYLPLSFSQLSALEFANFENNDADLMVNNLSKLTSLCVLKLKSNKVQHVYADIGGCVNLAKLDLSSNAIVMMASEIGLCTSLTEVLLSHNNLNSIPPELGACGGVEILDASYNRIRGQLADSIGQLRKLKRLVLSHNKITSFPHSIIGVSELTVMRADDNCIKELPSSFSKLHHLVELDLSLNNLTKFPSQVIGNSSLRLLSLHGNKLTLLPKSINQMTFLDKLDLSANKLRALPVEFVEILESVPDVTLIDNPWSDLPPKWNTGLSKSNEAIGGLIARVSSFADASNTMTVFKGSATAIERMPGQANNIEHSTFGNSAKDALNFLYGMKQVYDTCVKEWKVRGAAYYTHRLSISDFREEVRRSQPHSWHDGLTEHVDFLFLRVSRL
jgi:Leucine-rich repeat (LRR) protein